MSDEEFTAYLARAKQKSDAPDAPVDPISQVLVDDPTASKGKRGRKGEAAKESNKITRLEGGSGAVDSREVSVVEGETQVALPNVKGGRTLRSLPTGSAGGTLALLKEAGEALSDTAATGNNAQDSPSTWGEDFDPINFVAENLKGNSTKLDSLSLVELCKLAVGSWLKCLALNQMVFTRQEKEAAEKVENEVKGAVEGLKKENASVLKMKKADIDTLKKERSSRRKDKRNLVVARNAAIVALVKIWTDAGVRDEEMAKLRVEA
jgi:hypothetical protein